MLLTKKISMTCTTLMVLGAVATPFMSASAADRRVSAAACHFVYDNAGLDLYVGGYLRNKSTTNNGFAIVCPVATDSYLRHNSVVKLNIHGYEPAGESNYSRACVKHYNNSGNVCGPNRYWGTGYSGGADIDVTQWQNNQYSFPYVFTNLDKGGELYGMWYHN